MLAWLLGSATQVGAQTTYTVKCRNTGHLVKVHVNEVGDVPGHILGVSELAGVSSCDDGSVATTSNKAMFEYIKGSGKSESYQLDTHEDGSTFWTKSQTTVTTDPDSKTSTWEGTFEYIKGTGRFEGIQGSGTHTGKRLVPQPNVDAQFYFDSIGTYTLPSK